MITCYCVLVSSASQVATQYNAGCSYWTQKIAFLRACRAFCWTDFCLVVYTTWNHLWVGLSWADSQTSHSSVNVFRVLSTCVVQHAVQQIHIKLKLWSLGFIASDF